MARGRHGLTAQAVAANIRRLRKESGISVRDLAARTRDSDGVGLGPNAISEAELGRQRVDVDDLVRIARALDVSPTALLFPWPSRHDRGPDDSGLVALVDPNEELPAEMVWAWLTGHAPLRDDQWWDDLERQEGEKPEGERRWYDDRYREGWRRRFAPRFAWESAAPGDSAGAEAARPEAENL